MAQVIPHKSGGTLTYQELGNGLRQGHIRERLSISEDDTHVRLTQRIPEGARIAWASMKNVTAVGVLFESGTTSTTTMGSGGYALAINTLGAITSLNTSATTDVILRSPATHASAATFAIDVSSRGVELNETARRNVTDPGDTTDSSNYLFLAPSKFTTAAAAIFTFNPDTTTATSGYTFSADATVDVDVYFNVYAETPNNA